MRRVHQDEGRPSPVILWLLSCAACLLLCGLAHAAADAATPSPAPARLPDLLRFLRERLPSQGVVRAEFDRPDEPDYRRFAAFDVGFGAFVRADSGGGDDGGPVWGLSVAGSAYGGRLTGGPPQPVTHGGLHDSAVQSWFPFVILYDLVRRKEFQQQATGVDLDEEGAWTITFSLPQMQRRLAPSIDASTLKPVDVSYRIDSRARIIAERYGPATSAWRTIEYPSDSASPVAPIALSSTTFQGRQLITDRLVAWTFTPTSDPSMFEPEAALALSRKKVKPALQSDPRWTGMKVDDWAKQGAAALAASPGARNKPLPWLNITLGTFGLAVLATSAFLWLRRRAAA
ncbi:MAG: hypothetical protein IBJ11_07850 [Phycisphaerales bacterium]|nr:hypothetical protein [Phycisphaerales bacterium]